MQLYDGQSGSYYSENFNRGHQSNNGSRMFYRCTGYQNNTQRGEFHNENINRGRGNPNYRGNHFYPKRGNSNRNQYRETQPENNADLQRMQASFENWMMQGTSRNTG